MLCKILSCQRLSRRAACVCTLTLALGFIAPSTALGWFGSPGNPNNLGDAYPNIPGDPVSGFGSVLPVTPGINTARESFACFGFGCVDSFDSFRMEVPSDLQITLTEFNVPNADGTAELIFIFATDGVAVIDPVNNPDWQNGALFGLVGRVTTSPVFSSVVMGPGLYDVVVWNGEPGSGGTWGVKFTATAIPAPGAASLLSLCGFVVVRRRRKA